MTPQIFFRTVAIAEAITWTLLLTGMFLKYIAEVGDWGVAIGGGIHGFVFLVYAVSVVFVGVNQRWRIGTIIVGLFSAVIPYATIPFDIWADRTGRLAGGWRREATDHPRDGSFVNVTLRFVLRHPVIVGAIVAVGVVVVFSALLVIGPPGGKA
ncbi:DUF3817 domain-containing protein [Agromyces atrinae]|uniref:DUF3817 domain-containing protein n=1 Tax=Agromyces atrinae TaxID=592376 RepID=A0A4Q2M664_9MICO|nr:DUF3817 domain-containing protein [Agromyces atrinae]NYD68216.1 integral membrane protein [Agromyces atrinae]RXZ87645.1 DUF3817 domain-containing protein [Agromyces atrinae]